MAVVPNRLPWLAVFGCVIAALIVYQRAENGRPFVAGLPIWVLVFIALQVGLTMVAAWMARR